MRDQLDFRTMNNDMLLFAISRLLPSVSKYSWNLDAELSDEEAGVVRLEEAILGVGHRFDSSSPFKVFTTLSG